MNMSGTAKAAAASAWVFLRAIVTGVAVAAAGVAPWLVLAPLNAKIHPELPWAAVATLIYLALLMLWLAGRGWPKSTSVFRRRSLRLWQPPPGAWSRERLSGLFGIIALIGALYVLWIVAPSPGAPPDLSQYPTTAFRISVLVMGAVVSGVVEEMAFRGYMQSQLERFGPALAIVVTSIVFTLIHATHGLQALLVLAPGYFFASVLYGLLAIRTGSILPGMVLHVAGDALHTFFVLLGGDAKLLFASP